MNDIKSNIVNELAKVTLNHTLSDEEIIQKVLTGDKNSYEVIMRRYNQRLFRIGHAYLQDEVDIEDAIQSSYIKAYEQLERFENRAKFSTWLIRIFINEALARIKQKQRFTPYTEEKETVKENNWGKHTIGIDEMDNPYKMTINNELKEILEKAVNELPEKYRVVFIMREIEDMSVLETSKCLNITESNVKVRLNRAKEMLRESLSQFFHYEEVYKFDLRICNRIVNHVLSHVIGKRKDDKKNEAEI
ncbi:MAG: RNA polymerase sigma factor [Bacillota bacterium]